MLKIGDRVNADCVFEGREFVNENGTVMKFNKYTNAPYIEFDSGIKGWYITERYLTKLKNLKYKVGDRVVVNGSNDGRSFCNAIGTITRTKNSYQPYFIKFDNYSILNGSREGWWVREDQLTPHVDFLKVGDLVVGKYTSEFSFRLDGVLGRVARVDKGDTLYPYLVEFSEKTRRTFFWVGKNDISEVDEPKTKTQKYTTVWSKNPFQFFSVYDNITGEVIAQFSTFGEADDYIKSITQRYAQRFSITI